MKFMNQSKIAKAKLKFHSAELKTNESQGNNDKI